ncbi:hypothetical protein [Methyloferula stellata]|uniref:hypothetical protein n=1 Tax=Methyloferula stellata TaxID=876270 RepID=UPI001267DDCC|nr:hypothetical protein [Methyloferula stellata]
MLTLTHKSSRIGDRHRPADVFVARQLIEEKGLVSREPDANDARRVSLYPTALAGESRQRLGEEWHRLLRGIEDDPGKINHLTSTLRRIESELVSRRRRESAGRLARE